jgi:uncharacterized protein (UPF0261 family)
MIGRLNRALGPALVVVPARGFSRPNQQGGPLYVPEGNRAVIETFRAELRPAVPLVVADLHINDPQFADMVADALQGLLAGEAPHELAARIG